MSSSKIQNDFINCYNEIHTFHTNLLDKKKIALHEPSDEVSDSYREKAERSLEAAKLLQENKFFEESISLSYYAMYREITAVLRKTGIKCENHSATIIIAKELFNIDDREISSAKEERVNKQYYTDENVTMHDANELIDEAERFIARVDLFIEHMNNENKKEYRKEFEKKYSFNKQ
ncbi:MAG: HEPN domain-containing protein [Nanobdellota archaeon]